MAAGSAPATARSTTPPGVSAKAPRRRTWWFRTTPSSPTARSRSADSDERTFHLRAQDGLRALARHAPSDRPDGVRHGDHLSDAEEPELLVDLRRHPGGHAGA